MSEPVTRDDFADCLNTCFRVGSASAEQIELTLKQVSELKRSPGQESFFLIFGGPATRPLAQGTYPFGHERLGDQQIFIVPIGRDEQGISYEAIFNRLLS